MTNDIYKKMNEVMSSIDAIGKDKTNQSQGFKFRGIDQVYNEIHKIMAKVGIFCIPEVLELIRETTQTKAGTDMFRTIAKVKYGFAADDGSRVDVTIYGEGMDSGDKATSKALAIAHKYALLQAFMIPTEDMVDPDLTTQPETKKAAPPKTAASTSKPAATQTTQIRTDAQAAEIGSLLKTLKLSKDAALGFITKEGDPLPDSATITPEQAGKIITELKKLVEEQSKGVK